MTLAALRDGQQSANAAWALHCSISVFEADKEQLIAETEREVFQERRLEVCFQPHQRQPSAFGFLLEMNAGSLPTGREGLRHLAHLDPMHILPQMRPSCAAAILV